MADEPQLSLFVDLNTSLEATINQTLSEHGSLPSSHLAIVELVNADGSMSYALAFSSEQAVTRSVGLANVLRLHVEKMLESSLMDSWYGEECEDDAQ